MEGKVEIQQNTKEEVEKLEKTENQIQNNKEKYVEDIKKEEICKSLLKNELQESQIPIQDIKQIKRSKGHYIYDFVKIKVNLNEHYYIFSRFLITRMLTLCRIPKQQAQKIAKDIKKNLIAEQLYEVEHQQMESMLFQFMEINGYGQNYIERYKMTSKFFRKRIPLIILVGGAPQICKSRIATYLAERLNISNVLQTSIVEMMMKTIDPNFFNKKVQMDQFYENQQDFLNLYKKTSLTIRKGVHMDIHKCLTEGKPLIIEGYEISPEFYISKQSGKIVAEQDKQIQLDNINQYCKNEVQINKIPNFLEKCNVSDHKQDIYHIYQPDAQPDDSLQEQQQIKKRQQDLESQFTVKPLVIPLQLILSKLDLKYNIEHTTQIMQIQDQEEREKVVQIKLQNCLLLQNYQLEQSNLSTVIPVNIHKLEQTLDIIHEIILDKIQLYFKEVENKQ